MHAVTVRFPSRVDKRAFKEFVRQTGERVVRPEVPSDTALMWPAVQALRRLGGGAPAVAEIVAEVASLERSGRERVLPGALVKSMLTRIEARRTRTNRLLCPVARVQAEAVITEQAVARTVVWEHARPNVRHVAVTQVLSHDFERAAKDGIG